MKTHIFHLAISILAVLAPAEGMIVTALLLCLVDLFTGVLAARKQSMPITSAGLGRTIGKLLVYEAAIILAYLTETYMTGSAVPFARIVAGLIGTTELVSCLENINVIGGNNVLKSILDKIGSANK